VFHCTNPFDRYKQGSSQQDKMPVLSAALSGLITLIFDPVLNLIQNQAQEFLFVKSYLRVKSINLFVPENKNYYQD
jgi:hypothetical protein